MTRILVIHDSHSGRTARLAEALAEGAGAGAELYRVPPIEEIRPHLGPGGGAAAPEADIAALAGADALALGTPVHFGAPSAAILAFLARTARHWPGRALAGRPATVFAGAGSGGGAETAILTLWSVLASHGFVLVPGAPEAAEGPGGGPLGAVLQAGVEETATLARARAQGARLAAIAGALRPLRQGS